MIKVGKTAEEVFCGTMTAIKIFPMDNSVQFTKTRQISQSLATFQANSTTFSGGTIAMNKGYYAYFLMPCSGQFTFQTGKGLLNGWEALLKIDRFLSKFCF